jgi:hypothetical protein
MRRLVVLGLLAAAVWRVLATRLRPVPARVSVGYDDGTEDIVEPGTPRYEALAGAAAGALPS